MNTAVDELAALVDELERLVAAARVVPLTSQVRLDRDEIQNLVDRIRDKLNELRD